jgi:hypothetical protein
VPVVRWSGDIAIDVTKLLDYCLSPAHPRGRHKARVFQARLGFLATDAERLRLALLEAARHHDADFIPAATDEYGDRYILETPISGPSGSAVVRSAWIVLVGQRVLRLVTCYVV